jgi:hypothetical protein
MIKRFKIFERLGYNEEVSKLAEYVWKLYKQGEREIDLSEYTKKNMSIFVNKLFTSSVSITPDVKISFSGLTNLIVSSSLSYSKSVI